MDVGSNILPSQDVTSYDGAHQTNSSLDGGYLCFIRDRQPSDPKRFEGYRDTPPWIQKEIDLRLEEWDSYCHEAAERDRQIQRQRAQIIRNRERAFTPPPSPPHHTTHQGNDPLPTAQQAVFAQISDPSPQPLATALQATPETAPVSSDEEMSPVVSVRVTRSRVGPQTRFFHLDQRGHQSLAASTATSRRPHNRAVKAGRVGKASDRTIRAQTNSRQNDWRRNHGRRGERGK